ncbi:MAG TPA: hypothetical protein PLY73_12225, partial [Candidatus Ozemobacteraceae bacterium]|nr:hypothetical protein [Candidatus Ozemobacteraceae bacterium]
MKGFLIDGRILGDEIGKSFVLAMCAIFKFRKSVLPDQMMVKEKLSDMVHSFLSRGQRMFVAAVRTGSR